MIYLLFIYTNALTIDETISRIDDFYTPAAELPHLKSLLESSREGRAYTKLGELSLLVDHNVTAALDYFYRGRKQGDADSTFYLLFILSQLGIISDWDSQIPPPSPQISEYLFTEGSRSYSELMTGLRMANYLECDKQLLPKFNTSSHSCSHSCYDLAESALALSKASISEIKDKGTFEHFPYNLYEEQNLKRTNKNYLYIYDKISEGSGNSKLALAEKYLFGSFLLGIEKDFNRGLEFYQTAAKAGSAKALANLGTLYTLGIGVEQDMKKGLDLLQQAQSKGNGQAFNSMGYLHALGIGVEQDMDAAEIYFKNASDRGLGNGMFNLATVYVQNKNYERALLYYEGAYERGFLPSLSQMGFMQIHGLGTKRDCKGALFHMLIFNLKGKLSRFLMNGFRCFKNADYTGAYLNYAVAAMLGSENAQLSVAYLWEKQLSPFKCRLTHCETVYFERASNMFNSDTANLKLGNYFYSIQEFENAISHYSLADDNPESLFYLAFMYEKGFGTHIDLNRAKKLYDRIVLNANKGFFETEAQYPAKLALFMISMKENYPMMAQGLDYVYNLFNSLI